VWVLCLLCGVLLFIGGWGFELVVFDVVVEFVLWVGDVLLREGFVLFEFNLVLVICEWVVVFDVVVVWVSS